MEEQEKRPVGRPKKIESPEHLWRLFRQYKTWAKENPRQKQDFVGKDGSEVSRKLERPLSWAGFEDYLFERMIINDLGDYERNSDDRYAEFTTIVRAIKRVIDTDQFEGAVVGLYKENIIARKLGLADKQEARQVDKNGNDVSAAPPVLNITVQSSGVPIATNED